MAKLMMLVGIPASGKSTFALNYLEANPDAVILSSDAIRNELYGDASIQGSAAVVFKVMEQALVESLVEGKTVIYDATNLTATNRLQTLSKISDIPNVYKEAVVFKVSMSKCIERNSKRERKVPEAVIHNMYQRLQLPKEAEGFDRIRWIYR